MVVTAVQGIGGVGGVLIKTGISAAASASSTVASNAIQYAGDWDGFRDSMTSFDTWSGVIASSAGSLVTNSLNEISMGTNNVKVDGFNTRQVGNIQKLNSTIGGLASAGVSYGLTGEATFNVMNIADFISPDSILAEGGANCGLLEVSVGNNGVKARLGTDGIDVSAGSLIQAYNGYKEADKVTDWKYGSEESGSTLNAINMLGYTKDNFNLELASSIWSEETDVVYEKMSEHKIGYSDKLNNKIYVNEALLNGGKEGAAQLSSIFSHEGAHIAGADEFQSRIQGYDTYSKLEKKFGVTGQGYDSISDVAYMTEIYNKYGSEGLFTELFFGDAFAKDNQDSYFAKVSDPGWRQKDEENRGIPLGNGMTKEEVNSYNDLKKSLAYQTYLDTNPDEVMTETDFKKNKEELKKYGYLEADYSELRLHGCTLSTAAYIAYSITGELTSLKEANNKLVENNVFTNSWVQDNENKWVVGDGNQKNMLNYGKTYANAVNTLAGADVVSYSDSWFQTSRASLQTYLKLIDFSFSGSFVHLRTNTENHSSVNYHSVLLSGINLDSEKNISSLNILDPWSGKTTRTTSQIGRADNYKMTAAGQEKYLQTRYNENVWKKYPDAKYFKSRNAIRYWAPSFTYFNRESK